MQLDLRPWWARSRSWFDPEIGQDFLRVGLGCLNQRPPSWLLYLIGVANFHPINSLLAVSNQGNSAFDSNLHVFLTHLQSKVFWWIDALGKGKESRGLLFLREEVGEQRRQSCTSICRLHEFRIHEAPDKKVRRGEDHCRDSPDQTLGLFGLPQEINVGHKQEKAGPLKNRRDR